MSFAYVQSVSVSEFGGKSRRDVNRISPGISGDEQRYQLLPGSPNHMMIARYK